jgi:hypothetical protein
LRPRPQKKKSQAEEELVLPDLQPTGDFLPDNNGNVVLLNLLTAAQYNFSLENICVVLPLEMMTQAEHFVSYILQGCCSAHR